MAEVINARLVGTEFVRHYYTMLNERPDCLHLFFTQNSSYIHGGAEKPGEELPPIRGQAEIRDKIASLSFNDCRTKVLQVDAQETVGNAVLVQVSGELSNNGEPMRRFMQSFVLVPQSPKKFYVHNDIFRYQDEVFVDGESLSEDQGDGAASVIADVAGEGADGAAEGVDPTVPAMTVEVQAESQIPDEPIAANPPEPIPLTAEITSLAPPVDPTAEDGFLPTDTAASVPGPDPGLRVEAKEEMEARKEPEKEVLPPVVPSQKPFSWASLASKPQAAIKPERKSEATPISAPAPQRAPRSSRPDLTINDADRKWVPGPTSDSTSRRSICPDNQQLFVGNLPHSVTERELQEFFEQYGPVLEIKINRKGPATNLPNFGFVAFESTESVEKAMQAKPLMLYGKHRINVEEKKDHSELSSRSRANPRGRGGNYSRGGYAGRGAPYTGRPSSGGGGGGGGGPGEDLQQ